jgi:hypothetical protein
VREQFQAGSAKRERDYARDFEYLVLTVSPVESLREARQRVTEHAEYGKWELTRTVIYIGGVRRYWLRRKVMRVARTA